MKVSNEKPNETDEDFSEKVLSKKTFSKKNISKKTFSRKNIIIVVLSVVILLAVVITSIVLVYGKSKESNKNSLKNSSSLDSSSSDILKDDSSVTSQDNSSLSDSSSKINDISSSNDDSFQEETRKRIFQHGTDTPPLLSINEVKKQFGTFSYMLNDEEKKTAENLLSKKVDIEFDDYTVNELSEATTDNAIKIYAGVSRRDITNLLYQTHDFKEVIKRSTETIIDFYYPILNKKDNKYYYGYNYSGVSVYATTKQMIKVDKYEELLNPTKLKDFMKNTLKANKIYDITCLHGQYEGCDIIFYFETDVGNMVYYALNEEKPVMTFDEFVDFYCS